jgi:hypothetical protein
VKFTLQELCGSIGAQSFICAKGESVQRGSLCGKKVNVRFSALQEMLEIN